jgi:hypothetical protein
MAGYVCGERKKLVVSTVRGGWVGDGLGLEE